VKHKKKVKSRNERHFVPKWSPCVQDTSTQTVFFFEVSEMNNLVSTLTDFQKL